MHIDVHDILVESIGHNRTYTITGEQPKFESVVLSQPIDGTVTIGHLEDGVMANGRVQTAITLECHRCLCTFDRPVSVRFSQIFAKNPDPKDDALPIIDDQIDLAPVIESEIILSLPIKVLHDPDCPGIIDALPEYTDHTKAPRLSTQAHIKKGK